MNKFMQLIMLAALASLVPAFAYSSCGKVVGQLNQTLDAEMGDTIDAQELVNVLQTLNNSGNRALPGKFVTKRTAQAMGWRPGSSLWAVKSLYGDSIGGDVFTNAQGSLPQGSWHEADLDYHGGHRDAKRIVYATSGLRFVTVDHYDTFYPVEACY